MRLIDAVHPARTCDGITFERFLAAVDHHPRAKILCDPNHILLQRLDYAGFIDIHHERIKVVHVKDAEFQMNGRSGVYGGCQGWLQRSGRFRSLGDGQIDFKVIFSKLAHYDYRSRAVLEWECCLKHSEDTARDGAAFIRGYMIRKTERAFDDFTNIAGDPNLNRQVSGLCA